MARSRLRQGDHVYVVNSDLMKVLRGVVEDFWMDPDPYVKVRLIDTRTLDDGDIWLWLQERDTIFRTQAEAEHALALVVLARSGSA